MHGRVTKFIHHSNLDGEYLTKGYYVYFNTFQNDRSDYNAKHITVIEAAEGEDMEIRIYSHGIGESNRRKEPRKLLSPLPESFS